MLYIDLKCNFYPIFKCAYPCVPILLYTNFARHLVMNGNVKFKARIINPQEITYKPLL